MDNPINYWYQKYQSLKAEMDKMMKEAVEIDTSMAEYNDADFKSYLLNTLTMMGVITGQKVKLIICKKED